MRTVIFRKGALVVDRLPEPVPAEGQVLVKTLACGICGSDVHALHYAEHMVSAAKRSGSKFVMDLERDIVFGHEFCAEIVDYGPCTQRKLKPGTRVSSIPLAICMDSEGAAIEPLGYSNRLPGGFAPYMVLSEQFLTQVPNGLTPEFASLTEPMAVGWHATERADLTGADVPLVIGCGPVGLAVIAALRIRGIHPIVAADFSPARRALALRMGADVVVDPAEHSPYERWTQEATPHDYDPGSLETILGIGPRLRPGVIFECVGVPGIVQQIIDGALPESRVVVVGICMKTDHFDAFGAIEKQLNVRFVIGNTPEEFAQSMRHIADGLVDVAPLISAHVGIDDVKSAFNDLGDIEKHTKILVDPWR